MKAVRMSAVWAILCLGSTASQANPLYVANYHGSTISVVSPDTGVIITNLTTPICTAYSIVCDQANNLYVGNRGNGTVTKLSPDGIAYSILASNLDAGAVALGNSNVYTLGFYTGDIVQITPAGNVSTVASVGMSGGIALACDPASSNFYVAVNHEASITFGAAELYKITADGTISVLVDFGNFPNPYVQTNQNPYPQAMTIDANGNLFVLATRTGPTSDAFIYKVTAQGNVSTNALLPNPQSETIVSQLPCALAFDQLGRLNAYNLYDNTLYRVATNGVLTTVASAFLNPRGTYSLAFDTNGRLYTPRGVDRTIIKSDSPYSSWSVFVQGWLEQPQGLAFDAEGNLFVSNPAWGTIFKRTPAGSISQFVSLGFSDSPGALALDNAGNLYVSNGGYGSNLAPLRTISKISPTGNVTSNFAQVAAFPSFLAFDTNGNLFVSVNNGTIAKVTTNGSVSTFASGVPSVAGLAFGTNGLLYASDFSNNRIDQISTNGTVTTYVTGVSKPTPIVFDPSGNLYAGTYDFFEEASTLVKISPQGTITTLINTNDVMDNPQALVFAPTIVPQLRSPQIAAGNFAFNFQSQLSQSYTVQANLDLTTTNWFNCTNFTGNGLVMPVSVPASNGVAREFFRIKTP